MTDRIRVLLISSYMRCPPNTGGVIRIVMPIIGLSRDEVEVDILFGCLDEKSGAECSAYLERIDAVGRAEYSLYEPDKLILDMFPTSVPEGVWSTMSRNLLNKASLMVREKNYDIVQLEHSYLAWIVPFIRKVSPESRLVLDAHNVEHRLLELWNEYVPSSNLSRKARELRDWEVTSWTWFDAILSISAEESEIIGRVVGFDKVCHVPIAVDTSRYLSKDVEEKRFDILFIGSMGWYPNVHGLMWFIDEVLPLIEQRRPSTVFNIIGSGLQNRDLVRVSKNNMNIRFLGFQRDDAQYLHASKVFVVPLWIGAGARLKIPTAWASGVPVVSTTLGAEGNGAIDGENILLADDASSFADCVLRAIDDDHLRTHLITHAEQTAAILNPKRSAECLVKVYHEVLTRT